jgi:hypothetical protein
MKLSTEQEELRNREREAYVEMIEHEEKMMGEDAWETHWLPGSEAERAELGRLWDLEEMADDMDLWEWELALQEHLALGFSPDGLALDVKITTRGDNYSTGESQFGKVFIPNVALNFFNEDQTATCQLRFNGMDGTRLLHQNPLTGRVHQAIAMPWRCMRVVQ